jgi:DNA-binding NarL/FixJ family response regulator
MKLKLIHYSPLEKEVVSLFKTNLTQAEIAKKLGVGKTSVGNIVKKLGLKRSPRFKYRGYDRKKIESLERLGLSHIEIAGVFGVHITTLKRIYNHFGKDFSTPENPIRTQKRVQSRHLNQLNGTIPDCPHQTNILEKYADEIIGLLQTGVSKAEIARRYNVCPATVFNFIYLMQLNAPVVKKCDNVIRLKQAFEEGDSLKQIAVDLNCSEKSVSDKIKDLKWKRPRNSVKKESPLNNQEDLIKELYSQGLSGSEIAEQVHTHPISVYNKIRKMKLTRPQKWAEYRSKFSVYDDELLNLYRSGFTYKQIGEKFNIPLTTVAYRIKKLEVSNA